MNTAVAEAPAAPAAAPADWRELARAYNAHHFQCTRCRAAGRGPEYGQRCEIGAPLWSAYSATLNAEGSK